MSATLSPRLELYDYRGRRPGPSGFGPRPTRNRDAYVVSFGNEDRDLFDSEAFSEVFESEDGAVYSILSSWLDEPR